MYEYIDSNSDRIGSFKRALYNLDCLQIAEVAYKYIPECGFVISPTEDILDYGRLGFVQCWELRPVKPILYNLVKSSSRFGFSQRKRRTKLIDLYTLDYNEAKHKILKRTPGYEFLWSWNVIVSEYLLARQSYRNSLSGVVVGLPSAYYPEDIDAINILLSVSNYSPDWHRLVLNKRRKIV
jgi:hypothetical protein